MAICEKCGCRYSKGSITSEFRQWLVDEGWEYSVDRCMQYLNENYCLEHAKDYFFENVGHYEVCEDCLRPYFVDDAEEEFGMYLYSDIGYGGDIYYAACNEFHAQLCGRCNIEYFKRDREEFEDNFSNSNKWK